MAPLFFVQLDSDRKVNRLQQREIKEIKRVRVLIYITEQRLWLFVSGCRI